ncbi:MAG: OB-fold nucleic acid binding domain-containing protein [Terriglobales bacterium]
MPSRAKRPYLPARPPAPMHVFVSDMTKHLSGQISSVLVVVSKQLRRKKNNEPFLQLHLADTTGQVQANIWYNVLAAARAFQAGHVLEVVGSLSSFQDRLQVTIERLRIVPEAELGSADLPPGTTGKPDEFSSDPATDYLEHGKWLGTDGSAQMEMMTQLRVEQLKQKFVQGSTPKQKSKPVNTAYDSAEIRRRLAQSHDKSEELRRKYGPHPTNQEDDF